MARGAEAEGGVKALTVGSLFSGIGGIDLGLERAGMRTRWFSEIDPYASRVLKKHWPDVPNYGDITQIDFRAVEPVDVLAGGFPCQDVSNAGKREGIDGERSGLWSEYARAIGELRPRYVFVENVAALLVRGLDRVLGDLAALGYDAEWDCIPAAAVGAPHLRDRLYLVAYTSRKCARQPLSVSGGHVPPVTSRDGAQGLVAHPERQQGGERHEPDVQRGRKGETEQARVGGDGAHIPDPARIGRRAGRTGRPAGVHSGLRNAAGDVAHSHGERREECFPTTVAAREGFRGRCADARRKYWRTEPDVGRVADGVPRRMDRLRGLGNAVVPQIPEIIGGWIVQHAHTADAEAAA
jgi:DNA (cytosine-5)-methyltransferase 1